MQLLLAGWQLPPSVCAALWSVHMSSCLAARSHEILDEIRHGQMLLEAGERREFFVGPLGSTFRLDRPLPATPLDTAPPAGTSSHRALPTRAGRNPVPPRETRNAHRGLLLASSTGVLPVTRMLVSPTGTRYTRVLSALSAPAPSPDAEVRPPIRALRALWAGQSPARSDQRQRPLRPRSRCGSTL